MKLRSIHEIRAAAASGSLRKQARAVLEREAEIEQQRRDLVLPSQRRSVVEQFYGRTLEKLTGEERVTAEHVCVLHDRDSVIRFSENALGSRSLPSSEILRAFNANYAAELEKEIANVTDQLGAIYSVYGFIFNPDGALQPGREYDGPTGGCPPVLELKRRLGLAREAATNGEGGPAGIASAFSGML